jgi:hypothetical protein
MAMRHGPGRPEIHHDDLPAQTPEADVPAVERPELPVRRFAPDGQKPVGPDRRTEAFRAVVLRAGKPEEGVVGFGIEVETVGGKDDAAAGARVHAHAAADQSFIPIEQMVVLTDAEAPLLPPVAVIGDFDDVTFDAVDQANPFVGNVRRVELRRKGGEVEELRREERADLNQLRGGVLAGRERPGLGIDAVGVDSVRGHFECSTRRVARQHLVALGVHLVAGVVGAAPGDHLAVESGNPIRQAPFGKHLSAV